MRFSRAKPTGSFRVFQPGTRRVAEHAKSLQEARKAAAYWTSAVGSTMEIHERFPSGEWVTVKTVQPKRAHATKPKAPKTSGGSQAWDVSLGGRVIDTVFYNRGIDADEIRRGLINHDGYDPGIKVRRRSRSSSHATKAHTTHGTAGAWLPWKGQRVRIDPSPRTIKPFELDRAYVVRHYGKLYTIVSDVWAGNSAHPAIVEGTPSKRSAHATKAKADSDKTNIAQLAAMFGLPDWDKVDELNQSNYWEMSRGAEDEEAQMKAEEEAQSDVYKQWYDAVEHAAEKLFEEHGLELKPAGRKAADKRPYEMKIVPSTSWSDAANKIRETINGVGDFHFSTLREFLASGPYTARQAVISHLGYIKQHPAVYGGTGARQLYEHHWR